MSKYGVFLVRIFPYSVQIQENTDQKSSVFEHFLRSVHAYMLLLIMFK